MTVVCSHNDSFLCITKGADSVMASLCTQGLEGPTSQKLEDYAQLGLRTLVVGWKVLDHDFFIQWRQRFDAGRNAGSDREKKLADCAWEIEHSLRLAGISAIEDRLQDGVPEAICVLKQMRIRLWVLTGDKAETAVEIARACCLITPETQLLRFVVAMSSEHALEMLVAGLTQLEGNPDVALVLDGSFIKLIMSDTGLDILYRLAMMSSGCVCCRLAPQQKRMLVEMVRKKDRTRITLAIGDGANDTAMIQGAHVGIGVRGKEGNQAVQASDVAISQFRFLVPLLLSHGRRAYRRIAVFLCYYIYKHVVLAVGDMFWAHQSKFSGQIAYPEWLSSCYPLLFTSLPVIVIIGFDTDLPDEVVMTRPDLYIEGQLRMYFNVTIFAIWISSGIWHGGLAWLVPSLLIGCQDPDEQDFWIGSIASFTLIIAIVSLRLWLIALNQFALQTILVLLVSVVTYFITLFILGHTPLGEFMQPQIAGVPGVTFTNPLALAAMLFTPLALCFDAVAYGLLLYFRPPPLENVRWHARGKISRVSADKS